MKSAALTVLLMIIPTLSLAQIPVSLSPDQQQMLKSQDSELQRNKTLVYDFVRKVLEARHVELAPKFVAKDYIQHNPVVPTGRKGFMKFFAALGSPIEIQPTIQEPVIAIVAEKDLVIISFVVKKQEPAKPGFYTTTAFDMFRIENGLIAEHRDSELK